MPQSHIADQPTTPKTITATLHQEDNKSKATSYLFFQQDDFKLERSQSTSQQSKDLAQNSQN